jgi:hypothetical protein
LRARALLLAPPMAPQCADAQESPHKVQKCVDCIHALPDLVLVHQQEQLSRFSFARSDLSLAFHGRPAGDLRRQYESHPSPLPRHRDHSFATLYFNKITQ